MLCRPRCASDADCIEGKCMNGACAPNDAVLCSDLCADAGDTYCDNNTRFCSYGTDCADCGATFGGVSRCDDSCGSVNGICEDGGSGASNAACFWGQDCTDCGPRLGVCSNGCVYARNGICEEDTGECQKGTDCWDCGPFYGARGQVPCDASERPYCTSDGASVNADDGSCDCPTCAWDQGDCGGPNLCDSRSVSTCCGPNNPCGIDGDGYCDCGGYCSWEASDCTSGGARACEPVLSSGCDACVQGACCTEWQACGQTCQSEFACVQACVGEGTDPDTCFALCSWDGTILTPQTLGIIICAVGDAASPSCPECFTGAAFP
jgi:hypothetical protein